MPQSDKTDRFNQYLELPDDELEYELDVPELFNLWLELPEDELIWELDANCSTILETEEDHHQ